MIKDLERKRKEIVEDFEAAANMVERMRLLDVGSMSEDDFLISFNIYRSVKTKYMQED